MQLEKRELENDFGRKRAKFKELFIQKEGIFNIISVSVLTIHF